MRWKLTLEYDGAGFVGWQSQQNGLGVQAALTQAAFNLCGENISPIAAGRTDAGVHALGQVAHCDITRAFEPDKLTAALNAHLRAVPLRVVESTPVAPDFHARFDAIKRTYLYRLFVRRTPSILMEGRVWSVPMNLDLDQMRKAAACLKGQHDFSSFRASGCQALSPIKTLDHLDIIEQTDHEIHITVEARSFLYRQVRNMVGSLVQVGKNRLTPDDIKTILAARDRRRAGPTAPAHGLYFIKVRY